MKLQYLKSTFYIYGYTIKTQYIEIWQLKLFFSSFLAIETQNHFTSEFFIIISFLGEISPIKQKRLVGITHGGFLD
jgi:hypothetical protein